MDEPMCPTCGELLSFIKWVDEDTGEIILQITCEWCDYEGVVIDIGLKEKDLKKFEGKRGGYKAGLTPIDPSQLMG